MDASRIGSKPDALLQQAALPARESGAAERAAQAAPRSETPPPKPAEPRPAEAPEPTKPVVNTQGQTTGTRINTTA